METEAAPFLLPLLSLLILLHLHHRLVLVRRSCSLSEAGCQERVEPPPTRSGLLQCFWQPGPALALTLARQKLNEWVRRRAAPGGRKGRKGGWANPLHSRPQSRGLGSERASERERGVKTRQVDYLFLLFPPSPFLSLSLMLNALRNPGEESGRVTIGRTGREGTYSVKHWSVDKEYDYFLV